MKWCRIAGAVAGVVALLAILAISFTELFLPGSRLGASNLQSISGTVSFEGRPISQGSIEIVPQVLYTDQQDFTPVWAEIRNGEFTYEGLGSGLYLLRIHSELVETHQTMVTEEPLRQDPAPGWPCQRPAPVVKVRPDTRNHFDIRFE